MRKRVQQLIQYRSLLFKSILGVFCGVLAVLLVACGTAFWYIKNEMQEEHASVTQMAMANADVVFSQYLSEISSIATDWYDTEEITIFRTEEEVQLAEHAAFINDILHRMYNKSFIHSLYVFNREKECSLFVVSSRKQTENIERILFEQISDEQRKGRYFYSEVESLYENNDPISLLTIAVQNVRPSEENYTGTIAMNLDAVSLSNSIFSDTDKNRYSISVVDSEGRVVLSSDVSNCGTQWKDKEYIAGKLQRDFATDTVTENGKKWDYTFLQSRKDGYVIIARSAHLGFIEEMENTFFTFLVLSVILIVMTVLISGMCFGYIYRPLYGIIAHLSKQEDYRSDRKENDIQYLQNVYLQMENHIKTLRQNSETDFFVKNLILRTPKCDLQAMLLQNRVVYSGRGYYMVLTYLDNPDGTEELSMKEYETLRTMMKVTFSTGLSAVGGCTPFELGLRRLMFIITENENDRIDRRQIMKILENAKKTSEEMSRGIVYTVVSNRVDDGKEPCKLIYEILKDSLKMQQLIGSSDVFQRDTSEIMSYPAGISKKILDSIKKQDEEAYLEQIHLFINSGVQCMYHTFESWVITLSREILKLNKLIPLNDQATDEINDNIKNRIETVQTREELIEWFKTLYSQTAVKIENVNKHSNASVMTDVVDFIQNNYDNPDLNVSMLSSFYTISTAYFGKLFREFTGKSLSEYLTAVRMEKAAEIFLEYPGKDVAAVAKEVGITSVSYFSTVFRKFYGMPPAKYRDYINTQKNSDV